MGLFKKVFKGVKKTFKKNGVVRDNHCSLARKHKETA